VFEFFQSNRRLNEPGTKQVEGLSLGMFMYNSAGGGWYTPPSECKSPISDEITAEVTSDSES
jgi:hypothetical protein